MGYPGSRDGACLLCLDLSAGGVPQEAGAPDGPATKVRKAHGEPAPGWESLGAEDTPAHTVDFCQTVSLGDAGDPKQCSSPRAGGAGWCPRPSGSEHSTGKGSKAFGLLPVAREPLFLARLHVSR